MLIALVELIGVNNFICKSTTDNLKILTSNLDAYRALVHFLKDEKDESHTYQLKKDKPLRVDILITSIHHSIKFD